MACNRCHMHWSSPCPNCDFEVEEEYDMTQFKDCSVCNRTDVTEDENDKVADVLNAMDIDEFEMVVEAMGISQTWESDIVCNDCLYYYTGKRV